jgi:hypothetical protein
MYSRAVRDGKLTSRRHIVELVSIRFGGLLIDCDDTPDAVDTGGGIECGQ